MKKPWRNTAILLMTLGALAGSLYGTRSQALTEEARESMKLYTELLTVARDHYGGDIHYRDLVHASINGLARTLDPHTNFLPPKVYDGMRERQRSSFYGLGILVGLRNGRVTVITPIEGGPASRLGVRAGDIIDTIDGEPTESMSLDDAVGLLKGPKGSPVVITLLRPGLEDPLEMTVIRAEIPQTTVRYSYMMTPEVGYLRITDFNRGTGEEVAAELEALRAQGMKRLLLDLRNNGGGLLDQAIEVGEQFVPRGSKIVETRGRTRSSFQTFSGNGEDLGLQMPVVVLVNSGTASAAEIVAGAIQDHDIGIITGTPTWGKGLVQTVYTLSYGAGIALTTAKYYTPSGRLIQRDYSSYYDYYAYNPLALDPQLTEGEDRIEALREGDEEFDTDLGRKVYGGGGITPDVRVEPEPLSPFLQLLLTRSAFFNFGVDYHDHNPIKSADWAPDEKVMKEFRAWLLEKEIGEPETLDEKLAEEAEYVERQLRAEVYNAAFGQDAWHRTLSEGDPQVQAALQLFDQAAELLKSRLALADGDKRAAFEKDQDSDSLSLQQN